MQGSTCQGKGGRMKYPQGTRFIRRGDKQKRVLTVFDYNTTRNISGDIVKQRYVAAYEIAGHILIDSDITETTIARGETIP
jgi:ribosomal protein S25